MFGNNLDIVVVPPVFNREIWESRELIEKIKKKIKEEGRFKKVVHTEEHSSHGMATSLYFGLNMSKMERLYIFALKNILSSEKWEEVKELHDVNQILYSSKFSELRPDVKSFIREEFFKRFVYQARRNTILIVDSPIFELLIESFLKKPFSRPFYSMKETFFIFRVDKKKRKIKRIRKVSVY